ncbi:hypothetical protein [Herminiimonas contaminans]|uniref:Phage holin n=1 Tax=Herminiimonas contaminans TaxID=1111140 RepID=A0ABS0EPZ9_9BURK|nr:hypothetical protein [Herminiimonas contaminans]MBF8176931.1 hypothetical protein [Herminiimonas contaminans]
MAEPTSSTAAIAFAGGAITLTGSLMGVQYDTLLAGFTGGLISLSYQSASLSPLRVIGGLAGSALLAGFCAPVLALGAFYYVPWMRDLGDFLRIALAGLLGICAHVLIPAALALLPAAIDWVRDWFRSKKGTPP